MSIVIGADIVPTPSNIKLFESGNINSLIDNNLFELLMNAEFFALPLSSADI